MKIFKKIIAIVAASILILILSFNIFNFISIKVLGNELPTINGYAYLEVISGSMEPKISIGDIIIIDTKVNNYKVKDIVTFKDINDSFVTHRIIEIKEDEIITQGDANNTIDDPITDEQIVGRYICKLEGIGALMKSFRSPLTLVMILIIGIISCVLVSTDSNGNPILTEEEKEYLEFLESKKKKKEIKEANEIKEINKKTKSTKKVSTTKTEVKKKQTKKTSTVKTKETVKKESAKKTVEPKSKKEVSKKVTTKKETPKKERSKKNETKKSTTKKELSKPTASKKTKK